MRPIVFSLFAAALALASTSCSAAPQKPTTAKANAKRPAPPPALTLVQNGQSRYRIVVAAEAILAEQTAARELGNYLYKISGVRLKVENENSVGASTPQILVGPGKKVKSLLPKQNWAALGTDGIVVKTVGQNLILAGGRPRGSLYAVYSFLEDTLGVRWWTPGETTIPQSRNIRIKAQDTVYAPKLVTREAFYDAVHDLNATFPVHLKLNGHHQNAGPELGGHNSILGWCHTFDQLLPASKYFARHPEWYSDPDNEGKPCTAASRLPAPTRTQLNLTNVEARQELTKNALEWIRKNPEAGMISISQNDGQTKCNTPEELAIEKREGSPAGPLLEFVNAVAADIEKEFPGFLVETLAYQYTEKPPRFVRPRKNVVIRLCSIEADFSRPLESADNKSFGDNLRNWKKIAPRLYVWDYCTAFMNTAMPYPNLRMLGKNIRFFAANNTIGLFEQGDAFSGGIGDFSSLRLWLVSHLMWNPQLDENKLEYEFLRGYFGAAATPHLKAYFGTVQSGFAKTGGKLGSFQDDWTFLNLDTMNALTRHLHAAEAAAASNATFAERLHRESLSLDLAWILRYKSLKREAQGYETQGRQVEWEGPTDLTSFIAEYVKAGRDFKIRALAGQPFEAYGAQLMERASRIGPAGPLPEFARSKNPNDIYDAQEGEFRLLNNDQAHEWVRLADDPKASNGRSARIIGSINEWALQSQIDESNDFFKTGLWRVYAVARIEAKPGAAEGPVLSVGLYDTKNKVEGVRAVKSLAEMSDGEYHVIDLGTTKVHSSMFFWAAPPQRDDIEAVYIDRFFMVREPAPKK